MDADKDARLLTGVRLFRLFERRAGALCGVFVTPRRVATEEANEANEANEDEDEDEDAGELVDAQSDDSEYLTVFSVSEQR
jgi:hypothetical protein